MNLSATYEAVTLARPELKVTKYIDNFFGEGELRPSENYQDYDWGWFNAKRGAWLMTACDNTSDPDAPWTLATIDAGDAAALILEKWLDALPPQRGIVHGADGSDVRYWYVHGFVSRWQSAKTPIEALAAYWLSVPKESQ